MTVTQHARLGASSAYRWMTCTKSPEFTKGIPETTSPYAVEGTEAHMLAEHMLANPDAPVAPVTPEMRNAVRVYVDYCRERMDKKFGTVNYGIEVRVDLKNWFPLLVEPLFGTVDFFVVYTDPFGRMVLEIVDFKYGSGVFVPIKDNPQCLYYAGGVLISLPNPDIVKLIKMTVIQPRHATGPAIRSHTISANELKAWIMGKLKPAVQTIAKGQTEFKDGDHCRFCRGLATCPQVQKTALATAKLEFADTPTQVDQLSDTKLNEILNKAYLLKSWLKAVETEGYNRSQRGVSLPDWKLIEKRSNRSWTPGVDIAKSVCTKFGIPEKELEETKLISPAAVERLARETGIGYVDLSGLTEQTSTGTRLVSRSNTAPEVRTGPAIDFANTPKPRDGNGD